MSRESLGIPDLPPHSTEAEQGLIGSLLLDHSLVMPEIRAQVQSEAFYDHRHQVIWKVCCDLFDEQKPCDVAGVYFSLKGSGIDLNYINNLTNLSPSAYSYETYLREVQELHIRRKLIQYGWKIQDAAANAQNDIQGVLEAAERDCLTVRQFATPQAEFVDWKATRKKTMDEYEAAMSPSGRQALKTGFNDLDLVMGCMREQQMILIAGTPSAGKTSLALNIARHAAIRQGVKVGIISLETSGFKIVHRFNCIASGACGSRLINGRPLEKDITMLSLAAKDLRLIGENTLIYDRGAVNVGQAVSMMRKQYAKGCRLFILDYLQLLDANRKTANGNERMTEVSKAVKQAAKELDSPIIAISSLNRQSAKENRAPARSDLRETGQLEFDADVIILLHTENNDPDVRTVSVNVDKNKDGETGKLSLTFFPPCMQFKDAPRIQPD